MTFLEYAQRREYDLENHPLPPPQPKPPRDVLAEIADALTKLAARPTHPANVVVIEPPRPSVGFSKDRGMVMSQHEQQVHRVIVQKWEESERGWGTRPDGYSLHLSKVDCARFVRIHWNSMPELPPDEYSRPSGTPYEAEVDAATYKEIAASRCGLRRYNNQYPGSGGTDGWKHIRT